MTHVLVTKVRRARGWTQVRAAREGVALFDTSYFGKLRLDGPRADDAMQWLCAGDLEGKAVGAVT